MKAWMLIIPLICGCASRPHKARWEVTINLTLESQLDKMDKSKVTVEFKSRGPTSERVQHN